MAVFTVHVPSDGDDAFDRAERTTFVRDGFSVAAFLFGPLYLAWVRAWTAAVLWVVIMLGGLGLCRLTHLPIVVEVALVLLAALFTGVEASSLRRVALHRRGVDLVDVVEGLSQEDGERKFFGRAVLGGLPARRTASGPGAARPDEQIIGFFPHAGSPS